MALDGLEAAIKAVVQPRHKVHLIRYADDFVISGTSKEILETLVKPTVSQFLQERGLELSLKKTHLTPISKGFDFLGFNIRKYEGKLIIKPSKKSIHAFLDKIRQFIKTHKAIKTEVLLHHLNPMIRGWAYYYRHVCSKEVFHTIDNSIYLMLARWVKRRHPEKNSAWWRKHYFRHQGNRNWVFFAKTRDKSGKVIKVDLFKMMSLPIKRHIKIIAEATPYDPQYYSYFEQRKRSSQHRRESEASLQQKKD